jgi:hypothetical protein
MISAIGHRTRAVLAAISRKLRSEFFACLSFCATEIAEVGRHMSYE